MLNTPAVLLDRGRFFSNRDIDSQQMYLQIFSNRDSFIPMQSGLSHACLQSMVCGIFIFDSQ